MIPERSISKQNRYTWAADAFYGLTPSQLEQEFFVEPSEEQKNYIKKNPNAQYFKYL